MLPYERTDVRRKRCSMFFTRWFFSVLLVLAFNWGVASWIADEQHTSSALLKGTEKVLDECGKSAAMLETEYGARKAVCDLAKDRHIAIQMQLAHLENTEKGLDDERQNTHRSILGLMVLVSMVLFSLFVFGFTQRRHTRRVRAS